MIPERAAGTKTRPRIRSRDQEFRCFIQSREGKWLIPMIKQEFLLFSGNRRGAEAQTFLRDRVVRLSHTRPILIRHGMDTRPHTCCHVVVNLWSTHQLTQERGPSLPDALSCKSHSSERPRAQHLLPGRDAAGAADAGRGQQDGGFCAPGYGGQPRPHRGHQPRGSGRGGGSRFTPDFIASEKASLLMVTFNR